MKSTVFRALSYSNFALFISGQLISLVGTWMQSTALSWLVFSMTKSSFLLGVIGFAGQLPSLVLTPFTGVFADRFNRHHIIILTQTLSMIQASILAVLALTHVVSIVQIAALSLFLGIINSLDMPVRQSFVPELIDKMDDLGNAIAINSSVFNIGRLLGPSIAGVLIAFVGEGFCFLINALSYIPVIIALLIMKIKPRVIQKKKENVIDEIREGFSYSYGFSPIRTILLLLGLVSLVGMPYTVLMPVFAADILHGGPYGLGLLMASSGLGALIGAIFLASRKSVLGLGRWIYLAAIIFGAGLIGFSFSANLWLSIAIVPFIGFGMIVQIASSNTILQTIADEDKRGRVMSLYTLAFMGTAPLGSLLAGWLGKEIGVQMTTLLGGVCCIGGALLFALRLPSIRALVKPIYLEKGIVRESAMAVQSASIITKPPEELN